MAKKKRLEESVPMVLVATEPNKIYIYRRPWKLLNPLPYAFKLDLQTIKRLKNGTRTTKND